MLAARCLLLSVADYKEHHTDVSVKFVIKLTPERMQEALAAGLHAKFKLSTKMSTGGCGARVRACAVFGMVAMLARS